MKKFYVGGMSCASCSRRVETAVSNLDGVTFCEVNLLTNTLTVEGGDERDIFDAVRAAGYSITKLSDSKKEASENKDRDALILRLIKSVIFLIPLVYISMGHVMWNFPLPKALSSPIIVGIMEMLLSAVILVINRQFYINGVKGVIKRTPNMGTLVSLGSGVSFLWSIKVLIEIFVSDGNKAHALLHGLYFESAAMILVLITVGKTLEAHAKGKTTDAIKKLVKLTPKWASVIREGEEVLIPSSEVLVGDIFLVRPGESIATDGVVVEGASEINEASLTGESIPVLKEIGAKVYAGTQNTYGALTCRATEVGENTAMASVIRMVSDASASKAPISKVADRVSGIFVPSVIGIALISTLVWFFANGDFAYALERGISVLVISCPCALGLGTPVAIMVGSGIGAKRGILYKNATVLEITSKAKTVVLDKTGTITKGSVEITDIIPISVCKEELISLAASIEEKSEHPLARAIVSYAKEKGIETHDAEEFFAVAGNGVKGKVSGEEIIGGSYKFISEQSSITDSARKEYERLSSEGKTPLFFISGDRLLGIIAVADTIREDSYEAIKTLRDMGLRTVMLTGDNKITAAAIAESAGVDEFIAEVMPSGKEEVVRTLQKNGRVIMVGDGINDAPALVRADVGIAIGGGTDIAIDSADVVLTGGSLMAVPQAIKISRATLKTIYENLFWAFIYNVIGITVATGVFIPLFNLELAPMFGAFAMGMSSFSVVMNALRLNLKDFSIKKTVLEEPIEIKEETSAPSERITLTVKGMMCSHCEARVKAAIESVLGTFDVVVSSKEDTASFSLDGASADAVKTAITNAGYEVLE